jgi:hypothetical protein
MELSERIIATLESQGYTSIDEQQHTGNIRLSPTPFESMAIIYVTDGTAIITIGVVEHLLGVGDAVSIPPQIPYLVTVGPSGCQLIIGEK